MILRLRMSDREKVDIFLFRVYVFLYIGLCIRSVLACHRKNSRQEPRRFRISMSSKNITLWSKCVWFLMCAVVCMCMSVYVCVFLF